MANLPLKITAKNSRSKKSASSKRGKKVAPSERYRTKRDRLTGMLVTIPPASVPKVTSAQVRALLSDFP